jgi:transposase
LADGETEVSDRRVSVSWIPADGYGESTSRRFKRKNHPLATTSKKTKCGCCGTTHHAFYDRTERLVRDLPCGDARIYLEVEIRRVRCRVCGKVKQEKLEWLADNPFYTKRFMYWVGEHCRRSTIKDVAKECRLDWKTVKELEKQYMREQLKCSPSVAPRIVGIDEISVRKGHRYRIVVSDLERGVPIWFGGKDRSEDSMDEFYAELGLESCKNITLAVMDMWQAFEKSLKKNAPQAAVLYDKFHILKHLGEALDTVRKQEYARLSGNKRAYIKGMKWILLSNRENLETDGKASLRKLFQLNKRLATAYMLRESFGQLWSYRTEGWARRFFDNWKASLKWQRLKPFVQFTKLIERHWDGIASYCNPAHKVKLGFVEGLNNKIRVIQRRAYGIRDEEYLRLKVLTCMLPEIGQISPT